MRGNKRERKKWGGGEKQKGEGKKKGERESMGRRESTPPSAFHAA